MIVQGKYLVYISCELRYDDIETPTAHPGGHQIRKTNARNCWILVSIICDSRFFNQIAETNANNGEKEVEMIR